MQLDTSHFQQLLETERDQLQSELDRLQDENNENVDTDNQSFGSSNHPADAASDVMSRERNLAIAADFQADLDSVLHALERLNEGLYGVCEECKEPIPVERLEARPAATYCIQHQREREQTP